jgi:hypothetical protein
VLLVLGGVVLLVAIAWLARRPARPATDRDDRDDETLADAEREVRDLDALATPEDAADQLPDWGPGAPK